MSVTGQIGTSKSTLGNVVFGLGAVIVPPSYSLANTVTFTTSFGASPPFRLGNLLTFSGSMSDLAAKQNAVSFVSSFSVGTPVARLNNQARFKSAFAADTGILAGGLFRERWDNVEGPGDGE